MGKILNIEKRLIYAFEFSDKSVYVGLSYDSKKREKRHYSDNDSQVYKHINKTNLKPEYKELTDYLDKWIASKMEGEFLEKYKQDNWLILNKMKTGGLGRNNLVLWDKLKCQKDAKKYNTKTEWQKKSNGYNIAYKKGWLDDCCRHMIVFSKIRNFWNKINCLSDALKHKTIKDWKRKSSGAYDASLKHGWYKECTKHMKRPVSHRLKWSMILCKNEAIKYKTKQEWKVKSNKSYQAAQLHGWLSYCSTHM